MSVQDRAYSPPAVRLDGRGAARPLDATGLDRWRPEDGPLWVDLEEENERDRRWLARRLGAHDQALFLRESAWPKVRVPGAERLFLLLRVPDPDPGTSPGVFVSLRLWLESERVITMGPRALPIVQDVKDRLAAGRGPTSAGAFLLFLIDSMASRLADSVLELRTDIIDCEIAAEEERSAPIERIHRLKRHTIKLQRYADPQHALMRRLRSLDLAWLMQEYWDDLQGAVDYFGEGTRELDAIVERAQALQESFESRTREQMNRRIYVLTVVSTLLLPMSVITSLLGGNVSTEEGNILGTRHPGWFVALCIGLVLLGWGVYKVLRRKGFL